MIVHISGSVLMGAVAMMMMMDSMCKQLPILPAGFHLGTMARLSILDYLHRGVVYSLVGLSIYGIAMGVSAHKHVMQKGRGTNLSSRP